MSTLEEKYYVYALLDLRKSKLYNYKGVYFQYEPFYIGISKRKDRKTEHFNKLNNKAQKFKTAILNKVLEQGFKKEEIFTVLKENLTKKEAVGLEIELIKALGRRCFSKGPLANLTDGGEGGSNPSKETRKTLSKKRKGKKNGFYNKHHTAKTKSILSKKAKEKYKNSNYKNPNHNNKWSNKQKRQAAIRQKENHQHLKGDNNPSRRSEVKNKIRESKLGKKNPRYCDWVLIDPNGNVKTLEGGCKLRKSLKDLGFTKAMFYKKEKEYDVQKDGWKLKAIK